MEQYNDIKKQKRKDLETTSNRPSIMPQGLYFADILSYICDERALLIFKAITLSQKNDTHILITKLKLTRKQYYSSIQKLTRAGLVKRINGKYNVTSFGKVVFSAQEKLETEIETAIKYYWELEAVDSIATKMSAQDEELFLQQRQKIIDDLIDSNEIKDILLSREGLDPYFNAATKAGFIPVRRCFLTNVINKLSEQEIISLAEYVAKNIDENTVLFLKEEYDIKSTLDFLAIWIKLSGYPYRHEETNNNGQKMHSYVIQHDLGMKWSIYLANLYQFLFDELGQKKKIEFDKTENTLAFTIDSN
jgi:predicted transcriptional regulator